MHFKGRVNTKKFNILLARSENYSGEGLLVESRIWLMVVLFCVQDLLDFFYGFISRDLACFQLFDK